MLPRQSFEDVICMNLLCFVQIRLAVEHAPCIAHAPGPGCEEHRSKTSLVKAAHPNARKSGYLYWSNNHTRDLFGAALDYGESEIEAGSLSCLPRLFFTGPRLAPAQAKQADRDESAHRPLS